MKRLREYLNEDFDPAIFNHDGGISIDDPTVVDALNSNLEMATAGSFRTPYNALEEVRKVLAYYKIFLPKSVFLDQTDGNDVFQISQFGEKTGMNDKGEVVTADDSSLFVYFEWSINEKGLYDTFACVCNQEELDDVLDDFESEVEEELQEEMSPAEVSKLMYKVKNAMMSDEHKALVKSYMAKAISEQQMPDLKKKMGAKKVTLPNMMRKEEKDGDWSKDMKKQRKYAEKKLTPKAKAARDAAAKETINEVSKEKLKKYVKGAKADRDLAISDRDHYKKNLTDPDRAWTKGIPHKDSQYKMAVDRNARAMKRAKGIEKAEKRLASEDYDHEAATWSKKFASNARFAKSQAKANHLLARIDPNWKKEHNKEASKYTKKSKLAANKAVTGMDEETINELYGKGSLEKIRDYHKNKEAELGKRKSGLDNTVNDRRSKTKGSVTIFHNNGKKTHIKGHGEEELTSVERNRDSLQAKRDLAKQSIRRATGLIKKRKSLAKEETINEISHKLAKKAEHKSAKDYYDKYDAETKARGKYIKSKAPEDKAEADAAKEKRTKAAKRTIKFQQYADKKSMKEDYPGVQRRSNKTLDPDLQQKFKDYKSDQQARHSSNMVKMSYQNSPNQTFKTMGQVMPWKSTDSRAKYDATRDKIVDTQNQREIRRDPPITVNEVSANLAKKASDKADVSANAAWTPNASDKTKKYIKKKEKQSMKFADYMHKKLKEEKKSDAPFDNPTEKPSTPYKNKAAKAKQLARAAMKKALADKKK